MGTEQAEAFQQQLTMLSAMFGNAKPAMEQMMAESRKLQRTPPASTLVMETVKSAQTFVTVLLLVGLAGTATLSAQNPNPKFNAERVRLQQWTQKNRAEKGIEVTKELLAINPFESAKIKIPKVAPGGSVAITVPGKYPAGTVVLSERDNVTLSGTTMSATSYSTRMTVTSDEFPGFARLFAQTPISFDNNPPFLAVAFIDAVYRIDLKSANGITVKVTPLEKTFTIDEFQKNARVKYRAEFYKPGEAKPFETLTGYQDFNNAEEASAHFDVGFSQGADSPQEELEGISKKLSDPKITAAQRIALMQRMVRIQQKMMEADPASMNKKMDDFGCRSMQLYAGKSTGGVQGIFSCGKNFYDGFLRVTGTMTLVN